MGTVKDIFRVNDFISSASFWFPETLIESAWHQHAPFAFWLVETLRPRVFVELGTHHGFSYLAFCQAAQRSAVGTRGYAIGTWRGDSPAGNDDGAVYARLRDLHDPRYGGFSRLMRSTFDDALLQFPEKSVDLLHIDGPRAYDDAKHDFEGWKAKLSDGAIVLFHGVKVRDGGFGMARLWDEVRQQYPSFAFPHGQGLGVLAVGTDPPETLNRLFDAANSALGAEIRETYARLGVAVEDRFLVTARDAAHAASTEARVAGEGEREIDGLLSPRWHLHSILGKAVQAPREISNLLRRSWHKRPAALKAGAFEFSQLRYANYRKYASSRLILKFEPALSASFSERMRNRMAKNAPEGFTAIKIHSGSRALFDQMFAAAKSLSDEYVPFEEHASDRAHRVKALAFYLPQFHPIAENDKWWGKGFTEWTNVSKATPQFVGHYQPRLPGELGFYDLRVPEVMKRQVELAKNYGLHGFCFHYYWFSGRKRLLERPLNQFLADRSLDLPFCICWANENWTRRWDGSEAEILMEQRHEPQDDLEFIEDLLPVLKDERYIHVKGRPLIIVYRVNILPDARKTADTWRKYCVSHGIGEPWLVAAQSFGIGDPRPYGFDAAVEFPPHNCRNLRRPVELEFLNTAFQGRVHSYQSYVDREISFSWPEYNLYKTIVPSWDNEARRPGRGTIFAGSTPALYQKWLESIREGTDANNAEDDQKLVFINAWNEWAEGAHLEPDRRYGYAYLDATRRVIGAIGNTYEPSPIRRATIAPDSAFSAVP